MRRFCEKSEFYPQIYLWVFFCSDSELKKLKKNKKKSKKVLTSIFFYVTIKASKGTETPKNKTAERQEEITMTIYTISKERCEIRGFKNIKSIETMLETVLAGDREPMEIARYTDLEEAKAAFTKLTKDFKSDIKTTKVGGDYCTDFYLYTLEEWNTDEDGDIIDGGDIWEWSIRR